MGMCVHESRQQNVGRERYMLARRVVALGERNGSDRNDPPLAHQERMLMQQTRGLDRQHPARVDAQFDVCHGQQSRVKHMFAADGCKDQVKKP